MPVSRFLWLIHIIHAQILWNQCSGRWFAIQEIKTIVSVLIRYYKLTPKGPITFPTHPRMPMPTGEVIIQRRQE